MSCLFLVTDREFNHPIHQTTQNMNQYQQENILFSIGREFWQIILGHYPHNQLCGSSHKCMILTSWTSLEKVNSLSNDIKYNANYHFNNREIIDRPTSLHIREIFRRDMPGTFQALYDWHEFGKYRPTSYSIGLNRRELSHAPISYVRKVILHQKLSEWQMKSTIKMEYLQSEPHHHPQAHPW